MKFGQWIVALAIVLAPRLTPARAAETLTISGMFGMDQIVGTGGADPAGSFFVQPSTHHVEKQ